MANDLWIFWHEILQCDGGKYLYHYRQLEMLYKHFPQYIKWPNF